MAINETVVIDRPPQDVFADVSDLAHPEWQNKLLDATVGGEGPIRVGTRVKHRRRVGGGTRTFTLEVSEHDPPTRLAFRGVDGPVRPLGKITLERPSNRTLQDGVENCEPVPSGLVASDAFAASGPFPADLTARRTRTRTTLRSSSGR